jgi:hypothetical protein
MKLPLFTSLLLVISVFSWAQIPLGGPGHKFIYPNAVNRFIDSGSISWAMEVVEEYSLLELRQVGNKSIVSYLFSNALSGKLDGYSGEEFATYESTTHSERDKFSNWLTQQELDFVQSDSLDKWSSLSLHEIFYLDRSALACRIIAAAPLVNRVTSMGLNLGLRPSFYCCKNTGESHSQNEKPDRILLKRIEKTIDFDSFKSMNVIKQTYGMNLTQSIWNRASQGSIRILDIKVNRVIAAKDVWDYSVDDSVDVPLFDSLGFVIGEKRFAGAPVTDKLSKTIRFTQEIYFDRLKNVFHSKISDCYLFVSEYDYSNNKFKLEKRFKVL